MARTAVSDRRREAGALDVAQGSSPDNAACEGFFGWLKNELFYAQRWLSTTIEQFGETLDRSHLRRSVWQLQLKGPPGRDREASCAWLLRPF
jgi:hypothetical protein